MTFKHIRSHILLLAICLLTSPFIKAEIKNYFKPTEANIGVNIKNLSMNVMIEQGLRRNHDQHLRQFEGELLDINWRDTYYTYWFPQIDIVMSTSEVLTAVNKKDEDEEKLFKAPSGTLGIEVQEYSLFNWGKDYLQYQSDRTTYKRSINILSEKRRDLKHQLISAFFNLISIKKIEKIKKDQLRHASFIYRLNREKFTLRKIRKQEYLQSRDEYLGAQREYQEARMNASIADERIAYLIGDEGNTRYTIDSEMVYKKIFIRQEEAIRIAMQRNPDILNTQTDVENANRAYKIQQKENLPLPKISLNFGAYKHVFGRNINQTRYERTLNNGDLELSASINATWNLLGEGGLFNSRKTAKALVTKNMAIKNYLKYKHVAKSSIREYFKNIVYLQSQIDILEVKLETIDKTFDTVLDNYTKNRTSFINLKDALQTLTSTKIGYTEALYKHIENKIKLAQVIGIENLPNEIFEQLVKE